MAIITSKSTVSGMRNVAASVRPVQPRKFNVVAQAQNLDRRQFLEAATVASIAMAASPMPALAAKGPSGFNPVQDLNDNYQFIYPFGWQEITVNGADVVYKDVIEPLESVSVTLIDTDKKDITEFGPLDEVAETLAKNVLTAGNQDIKIIATSQKEVKGRNYYEFEFTASNPRYTRHSLAAVTIGDGKFYTITTGANEKRWGKMKDRLSNVIKSFALIN